MKFVVICYGAAVRCWLPPSKVVSNKNTLPILDYFLLDLNGKASCKITASDLETTLDRVSSRVDSVEERRY